MESVLCERTGKRVRGAKKIFESSGQIKVEVHRFHVNRARAAVLVVVEYDESAGTVRDLRDGAGLRAKSILKTNMREGNDERIAIDELFVSGCANRIAFCL